MNMQRIWRHLTASPWRVRRVLPRSAMQAIEHAIRDSERTHRGQICFAIEGALDPVPLLRGVTARRRAIEVFTRLRVWDTEHNNGVLIYLLLADRDVEIVADRGFNRLVAAGQWQAVCEDMERHFRAGNFHDGALVGIREVGRIIASHYPQQPGQRDEDELPNRPALL